MHDLLFFAIFMRHQGQVQGEKEAEKCFRVWEKVIWNLHLKEAAALQKNNDYSSFNILKKLWHTGEENSEIIFLEQSDEVYIINCVGRVEVGKKGRKGAVSDGCPINKRKTSRVSIIILKEAGLEGTCEGGGT